MGAPDSLDDVKELLEAGWEIRWDGRTGGDYPPNYRLVELEKDEQHDDYTPVKQLHLLAKDYEEVEELREDGEGSGDDDEGTDDGDGDESGEEGSEAEDGESGESGESSDDDR